MRSVTQFAVRRLAPMAALLVLVSCNGSPAATPSPSPSPEAEPCLGEELERSGFDGVVVDTEGNPVGDILVQLDNGAGFVGDVRTGEDGVFFSRGVVGRFVLTTVDIDYAPVTDFVEVPCGEMVDVELVLEPPAE
jgi:hypothetical protein